MTCKYLLLFSLVIIVSCRGDLNPKPEFSQLSAEEIRIINLAIYESMQIFEDSSFKEQKTDNFYLTKSCEENFSQAIITINDDSSFFDIKRSYNYSNFSDSSMKNKSSKKTWSKVNEKIFCSENNTNLNFLTIANASSNLKIENKETLESEQENILTGVKYKKYLNLLLSSSREFKFLNSEAFFNQSSVTASTTSISSYQLDEAKKESFTFKFIIDSSPFYLKTNYVKAGTSDLYSINYKTITQGSMSIENYPAAFDFENVKILVKDSGCKIDGGKVRVKINEKLYSLQFTSEKIIVIDLLSGVESKLSELISPACFLDKIN